MESEVERRGKLLEFEAGAKTDGPGLSTLIWSSQRCLTFLCILSLCSHPTGLSVSGDYRIKLITCRKKGQEGRCDRRDRHAESVERMGLEISEKMMRSNYFFFLLLFSAHVFLETYCMSVVITFRRRESCVGMHLPSIIVWILTFSARAHLNHFKRMFSTCLSV